MRELSVGAWGERRHARAGGACECFHRSTPSTRVIDACSATWLFHSVGRPPSTRRVAESLLRSAGTTSGPAMIPTPQPHQNRRLGQFPYDTATNAGAMTKRKVSLLLGQEIYRRARQQYVDRGPQDIGLSWPRPLRHVWPSLELPRVQRRGRRSTEPKLPPQKSGFRNCAVFWVRWP